MLSMFERMALDPRNSDAEVLLDAGAATGLGLSSSRSRTS